ncbi:TPA: lytic transglycosylase catalytic [Citrobacter freundii]|uniref:lytic transglycosylase catalytic n=2 Tax=Citrobacter freundii TaxID=546 RepID=UPI001A214506|nr:lytic transglycosylase catalytic [Citrobacter freundii]MDN4299417.1 lytic transglycosylase catalytic [Citrobacter freundii]HAU5653771.1 lytic transglycosylase catalytic [Citrobacter freundii]HAU5658876.1 lytic transglycosylase catalytic [Citrobacter freundii]HBC0524614.1 lytic transglycosylase catalytic [Citrobacter freundii]HBC0534348.1 lytic transglycosylase catalytic [Citrobacter freundii]
MSGNADTIKDFLVSLGFDIDQAGANKFEAVLKGVTANVLKVGAVVEGAALSIVGFTTQIANGLDKIYWASQRTGASVQGIKALGYAASQTGASAESAMSSLEGLAGFMRSNPGAEGFLNRLGVQTRDASGKMRDTAAIFTGVGQKLNNMPYYRAKQYAQMLGIDENTLMAMRRGMNGFTADYQSMLQKTGFNADKAAVQSNKFMTSMRGLTSLFGIMRDKIGSNLAGGLAGSLDSLRRRILDNFPKIEETLTKVIKGVIWLANAFTRMAWRLTQGAGSVIDWWKRLDEGSKNLLKIFGALLVAWRLLNSAFLKSPIGIITTLILAIGLLYDDYQTWKEGGKSLIDWSKWEPAIEKAKKAILWLRDKLLELKDSVGGWQNSLEILATFIAGVWVTKVLGAFAKISGLPIPPWLKLWGLYAGYVVSDRENIKASAQSSWNYAKRNVGDALAAIGIKADLGHKDVSEVREWPAWMDWLHGGPGKVIRQGQSNGVVYGNNIQPDIPGAEPSPGGQGEPRGIRNNNPGNIDFRGQSGATLEKPGGRFARFETAYDGLKALSRQLMRYFEGKTTGKPLQTLNDIISTWAPGNENNTGAYIANLSKMMGVAPDAILNLKDPQVMTSLMNGIIHHENGRNPYPGELVRMAAGGGTSQNIQQETVINIHGVSDPREAANITVERQKNVNSQLTQQLRTVPS